MRKRQALASLFLFFYERKRIHILFLCKSPKRAIITVIWSLFFFFRRKVKEKVSQKNKKLLLQNENKQSILTFVNLRAEVVVTT